MVNDGRAEYLEVAPGMPVGVRRSRQHEPITVQFAPGSTLVGFTDGLIEQRGRSLDAGLGQLAAVAADSAGELEELITRLLAGLTGGRHEDDIAILAVRCSAQRADPRPLDSSQSRAPSLSHPST